MNTLGDDCGTIEGEGHAYVQWEVSVCVVCCAFRMSGSKPPLSPGAWVSRLFLHKGCEWKSSFCFSGIICSHFISLASWMIITFPLPSAMGYWNCSSFSALKSYHYVFLDLPPTLVGVCVGVSAEFKGTVKPKVQNTYFYSYLLHC